MELVWGKASEPSFLPMRAAESADSLPTLMPSARMC